MTPPARSRTRGGIKIPTCTTVPAQGYPVHPAHVGVALRPDIGRIAVMVDGAAAMLSVKQALALCGTIMALCEIAVRRHPILTEKWERGK